MNIREVYQSIESLSCAAILPWEKFHEAVKNVCSLSTTNLNPILDVSLQNKKAG